MEIGEHEPLSFPGSPLEAVEIGAAEVSLSEVRVAELGAAALL